MASASSVQPTHRPTRGAMFFSCCNFAVFRLKGGAKQNAILLVLLCIFTHHFSAALTVENTDYFVYNDLTEETESIGFSLGQRHGLLYYGQENTATVSDDNLLPQTTKWYEYKLKDDLPDVDNADVKGSIFHPFVLLGSRHQVRIVKYTGSFSADFTLSTFPVSGFFPDQYAMGDGFFAVAGVTGNVSRTLLIYEHDGSDWSHTHTDTATNDLTFAVSLAAISDKLAYAVASTKIVIIAENKGWETVSVIESPVDLETHPCSKCFGFALYSASGILAVGAPFLNVSHLTGKHQGKVFLYNVSDASNPNGPFVINPHADLVTRAEHSETGSTLGVQFGTSLFISDSLLTTSKFSVFLGVGAPGANGVMMYFLEGAYDGSDATTMFENKEEVFVAGFRLQLDHDTGDATSWDYHGERLMIGAPDADNIDTYSGSETKYGQDGRLYLKTMCQPNRHRFSPSIYSYIYTCKDCASGKYSHGLASSSCKSCSSSTANMPANAEWGGSGKGCIWACKRDFFGPQCETCAEYMLPEQQPPSNTEWASVDGKCVSVCLEEFVRSGDGPSCVRKAAPKNLTIASISWSSLALEWNDAFSSGQCPESFVSVVIFSVARGNAGPLSYVENRTLLRSYCRISEKKSGVLIDRLLGNARYRFFVREGTKGVLSNSTREIVTLPPRPPSTPLDINMLSAAGGTLSLAWSSPEDNGGSPISNYTAIVCRVNGIAGSCVRNTTRSASINTIIIRGLRAKHTYTYQVAAMSQLGGSLGELSSFLIIEMGDATVPSAPGQLQFDSATCESLIVRASPLDIYSDGGSTPFRYSIRIVKAPSQDLVRLEHIANVSASGIVELKRLSSGESYTFSIYAENVAGEGASSVNSAVEEVALQPCLPHPPTNLHFGGAYPDGFQACFARPSYDGGKLILSYVVSVYNANNNALVDTKNILIQDSEQERERYNITRCFDVIKLNGNTKYFFRVQTNTSYGLSIESQVSPEVNTLQPVVPLWGNAAKLRLANDNYGGRIKVTWDKPQRDGGSQILYYRVQWKNQGGNEWTVSNGGGNTALMDTIIYGLIAGSSYVVQLFAANAVGTSITSLEESITAGIIYPAFPPNSISLIDIQSSSANISWVPPSVYYWGGALLDGFQIVVRSSSGLAESWSFFVPASQNSFVATGLSGSHEYRITIASLSNSRALLGNMSDPIVFTTSPPKEPNAPTEIHANDAVLGSGHVHLWWLPVDDDGGRPVRSVNVYAARKSGLRFAIQKIASQYLSATSDRAVTVNGLLANTTYFFLVRLVNDIGASENSSHSNWVTTKNQAHPGTAVLSVLETNRSAIRAFYSLPLDFGGARTSQVYLIIKYMRTVGGIVKETCYLKVVPGKGQYFDIPDLKPGSRYLLTPTVAALGHPVQSLSTYTNESTLYLSDPGMSIAAYTGTNPSISLYPLGEGNATVSLISGLLPTRVGYGTISLTWDNTVSSGFSYKLSCIGSNGLSHKYENILEKNFTISSLQPQTSYTCCVVSIASNGDIGSPDCKGLTAPIITKIESPPAAVKKVNVTAHVRSSELVATFVLPPKINGMKNEFYRIKIYECHANDAECAFRCGGSQERPTRTTVLRANETGKETSTTLHVPGVIAGYFYAFKVAVRNGVPIYSEDSPCSNTFQNGKGEVSSKPVLLQALGVTPGSVKLRWKPPKYPGGVSVYNISYVVKCWPADNPNTVENRTVTCNNKTSVVLPKLIGDTEYRCNVLPVTTFGIGSYSDSVVFNTLTATLPEKPQSIAFSQVAARPDAFTLVWDAADSSGAIILGYNIYIAEVSITGEAFELATNSTVAQATVSPLLAQTQYKMKVTALNRFGEGPYSDVVSGVTANATIPTAISEIRIDSPKYLHEVISLSWSLPQMTGGQPLSYDIYQSGYSSKSLCEYYDPSRLAESRAPNGILCSHHHGGPFCTTEFVDGLSNELQGSLIKVNTSKKENYDVNVSGYGKIVRLVIVSRNSVGTSPNNLSVIIVTPIIKPNAPINVKLEEWISINSSGLLTWDTSETGGCHVKAFHILEQMQRFVDGYWQNESLTTYTSIDKSFLAQDLQCHLTYSWKVRVETVAGNSSWSVSKHSSSSLLLPNTPKKPIIVGIGSDYVVLHWDEPTRRGCPINHFNVEQIAWDHNLEEWRNESIINYTTSTRSITVNSLHCFSKYRWRLNAGSNVGTSAWSSAEIGFTTKAAPSAVCGPVNVTKSTPISITIEWQEPCDKCGNDVIEYEVRIKQYDLSSWLPIGRGSDASPGLHVTDLFFTFTGLDYFTRYQCFVRAKSSLGTSPWSRVDHSTLPRKTCPYDYPRSQCNAGYASRRVCSCHGVCHSWDGTCSCDGGWKGQACNILDGEAFSFFMDGEVESWTNEDKADVAEAMAKAAGINSKRIPPEYIIVEAGSVKVTVKIQNPLQKSGLVEGDTRSAAAIVSSISQEILDGGYSAIPISGIINRFGKKIDAPPIPTCSYVDEDSCSSCLSQIGCGWCDYGQKWCGLGTNLGPAFMNSKQCPVGKWRYGNKQTCEPTSTSVCAQHSSCTQCLVETKTRCAWCAESNSCIPNKKEKTMCPNWGFVSSTCKGNCAKSRFEVALDGYVWMGDDHPGSELFYGESKQCKWHIAPGQDPSAEQLVEVSKIDIILERADIGRGDRLIVYKGDGRVTDSSSVLIDINGNSLSGMSYPIRVTTDSVLVIFEFTSDRSPHTVGTGFLASFKGHPKTLWDSYILISIVTLFLVAILCCCCFKCFAAFRDPDGHFVENELGLRIEATERGASVRSINKFPTFSFTADHRMKMEKLQQEMACSICLGDYEEGEDIRLLPCGHMFHVPCIDAWLQINRICPLCKADVNVLAADKARDRKKEKRKNFFKKLKWSGRGNAVSPRSETFADRHQELLQISDGNDKGKKKKKKKKKRKNKNKVNSSHNEFYYGNSDDLDDRAGINPNERWPGAVSRTASEINPPQLRPLRFPGRRTGRRMSRSGWDSSDDEDLAYSQQVRRAELEMTSVGQQRPVSFPSRRGMRPRRIAEPTLGVNVARGEREDYASVRRRGPRGSVSV